MAWKAWIVLVVAILSEPQTVIPLNHIVWSKLLYNSRRLEMFIFISEVVFEYAASVQLFPFLFMMWP